MKWDERNRSATVGNEVGRMETKFNERKRCGTNGNDVG